MPVLNNGSGPAVKRIIYGDRLQAQLGRWSPTNLALLGYGMETGEVALTRTMPRQTVAAIPTISMALLRSVRRATPLELEAMKRGRYTVEALHKEQLANHRMSDAELKRTMLHEGLDRVLALLDELTRPGKANGHAAANDNGNGGVAMPVQLSL